MVFLQSAVQNDVVAVAADVERNSADITTLATFGIWCGEQDQWTTDGTTTDGTITYDSITFSASNNMNIAATPLDINTGITRHKCYYCLDIDICHMSHFRDLYGAGVWSMETEL